MRRRELLGVLWTVRATPSIAWCTSDDGDGDADDVDVPGPGGSDGDGERIDAKGDIEVVIDGEPVDLPADRYQAEYAVDPTSYELWDGDALRLEITTGS